MLFSGMILIFSPDSVQADTTSYFENFDTTGIGNQVDTLWFDTETSTDYPGTHFYVIDDQGGNNQFQVGDRDNGAIGWFNFTYNINKIITNISFNYYGEYVSASAHGVFMFFNNSADNTIIKLFFQSVSASLHYIYYYSHSLGQTLILGDIANAKWTQFSLELVDTESIRYSCANVSILSNGNIDTDYYDLNNRIDSVYSFCGSVGGGGDGTKLIDNLSVVTNYNYSGSTTINVYNETSPSTAIPDWNLRIYDDNNLIYYSKNNLNNPVSINHSEYGTGNMFFEISASGYYNRTYYADIRNGVYYNLTAFLLNTVEPDANIYTCIVVDDSDLDHIIYINDATISITRVINGSIHEVSSGFTDGSGRFYVPLIADITYTVNITATGYNNLVDTYVPSSTVFEQIFRMTLTSPTQKTYDMFFENISITISMVSAGCMQLGNITITYLDYNSSTTNTSIQLWEIYGRNNTLLNTWYNTSNSFFNKNSSINTTRMHFMTLYFNNTADFTILQPIIISIPNVDSPFCDRLEPFDLDKRIKDVIGPVTIGDEEVPWSIIISIFIPMIVLVSFGPYNTGLGIIGSGISMVAIQGFLNEIVIGGFNWFIASIGIFIIVMGFLYMMTKGTGVDHL